MDYEDRIIKLETLVETLRTDIDRLFTAIAELRDHTDRAIAEVRLSVTELRDHTDRAIAELRDEMNRNFQELRREAAIRTRWEIGTVLTLISLIIGLYAKLPG